MRVHHLNCISSCPLGGRLMDGRTAGIFSRGALACHCFLVETEAGLVLCDTGFGTQDVIAPRQRLSTFFLALLSPDFRHEMTARSQIERLGFDVRDVRHIVLTHLDFDHAGGLDDFPYARVHMLASEKTAALQQATWLDRQRFRPQQWSTMANWTTYTPEDGESWFGFSRVQQLIGLPPDILLVPLLGHTLGHAGIAIKRQHDWLLQAGDAYFCDEEMRIDCPRCAPGLRAYQWLMEKDRPQRLLNQERLRGLRHHHGGQVCLTCSHDPAHFEQVAGRRLEIPAGG